MRRLLLALLLLAFSTLSGAQTGATCTGAFPNLISDVCYDCVFPITLAGVSMSFGITGQDYDDDASSEPICICASNLAIGIPTSFWEPEYMVDVTNKPGCFPLLGGVDISPPVNSLEYGGEKKSGGHVGGTQKNTFMQVNQYLNPVMTALGLVPDSPCLDDRGFDVPYISWADPTWNDDSLAMILTPYGYAFTGLPAVAAEMPDSIAATVGFPLEELFWVAGAWGGMYPVTGTVPVSNTSEQVAHLLVARMFAKLHAAGVVQSTAGTEALQSCGAFGVPEFIMDKRQYKTNRTFPFPDNTCTPIGRPLVMQEAGASRPQDKDYGYFIFRKKDCCASTSITNFLD